MVTAEIRDEVFSQRHGGLRSNSVVCEYRLLPTHHLCHELFFKGWW